VSVLPSTNLTQFFPNVSCSPLPVYATDGVMTTLCFSFQVFYLFSFFSFFSFISFLQFHLFIYYLFFKNSGTDTKSVYVYWWANNLYQQAAGNGVFSLGFDYTQVRRNIKKIYIILYFSLCLFLFLLLSYY
jgi:hypothetical protein